MGKKDRGSKSYFADPIIFSELFNRVLYKGKTVLQPEKLQELDPGLVITLDEARGTGIDKTRDVLKEACVKKQGGKGYLVFGIEAQSDVHYAMPARCILYDSISYYKQMGDIAKRVEAAYNEDKQSMTKAEWLSRFRKTDKLIPVVTLVVYLGPNKWDGPRCLYDMLPSDIEGGLVGVANYNMNLLVPAELSDEEIAQYETSLNPVLKFIKESGNNESLVKLITSDKQFKTLDSDAAKFLKAFVGNKITITESEGGVDMCKAIEDMLEKERQDMAKKVHNENLLRAKELLGELSDDLLARAAGVTQEELAQLRAGTLIPE